MIDGNDTLLKAQSEFKSQVDKVFEVSVLYLNIYFPDIFLLDLLTICILYSSFSKQARSFGFKAFKVNYSI